MTAERSPATLVSRRILDTLTDYDTKNVQTIVYEADCRRKALFHDYFGTSFLLLFINFILIFGFIGCGDVWIFFISSNGSEIIFLKSISIEAEQIREYLPQSFFAISRTLEIRMCSDSHDPRTLKIFTPDS